MRDAAILVLNSQSAMKSAVELTANKSATLARPAVVTNDEPPPSPDAAFGVRRISLLMTGRQDR